MKFTPDAATRKDVDRIQAIWRDCRERYGRGGPFLFGAFGNADRLGEQAWAVAATLGVLFGAAVAMAAVVLVGGTLLKFVIQ